AQLAPPGSGIFQEGDEIGNADDIDGCCPQVRIGGDGGKHHEAAVAAAHDYDTPRVCDAALLQPERGVLQVRDRVHAQAHIVQALVLVAVAGAAAHIGYEERVALRDQVLRHPIKI